MKEADTGESQLTDASVRPRKKQYPCLGISSSSGTLRGELDGLLIPF